MTTQIHYKSGYLYQLADHYTLEDTGIRPADNIDIGYIRLDQQGDLLIRAGYCWDGPSGPAIDTKNFMRGSLVHDALYQLMRAGKLNAGICRGKADMLLKIICREDGMSAIRAWWVYKSLKWFGGPAADQSNRREILTAP